MKKIVSGLLAAFMLLGCKPSEYDVCIYGGTSAGVIAAYTSAMQGKRTVLIEPYSHFGGMTTGGLGYTDIGNKQVVKGLAKQFYRKTGEHYGVLESWVFEPSVADSIMKTYLDVPGLDVMPETKLVSVNKNGARILSVNTESGREIRARMFIDCSYEGDLMSKSGVSYRVGREDNSEYGETIDGVQLMNGHQFPDGIDPYRVPGDPSSGLLWGISDSVLAPDGTGDDKVQAYNYRICLTDDPQNMVPITKPDNYDPSHYDLLPRLFEAMPGRRSLNNWFIWSPMPGRKTDVNNRGAFSTDMIGENWNYPEADYEERERIVKAHEDYTKGLLYFYGHDERVPDTLRRQMLRWGYPKDEYQNNGHWSPQLYVREARRMVGSYVATQADCEGRVVPEDGIAMAAYTMDSHNCQRIVVMEDGKAMVKNEGNVEIGGGLPYPISYRSIVPKREECENLLVPVCLSASHIAYGSIRMEPVFMVLAQAASIAAAQAGESGIPVQDVDYKYIVDKVNADPYMDGTVPDIIVDDQDAVAGDGWRVVSKPGGYGPSWLQCDNKPACKSSVSYAFSVHEPGRYAVYIYQNLKTPGSKVVPVEVHGASGAEQYRVDLSEAHVVGQTHSTWVKVCEADFDKDGSVTISASGAEGSVRADAVLILPLES